MREASRNQNKTAGANAKPTFLQLNLHNTRVRSKPSGFLRVAVSKARKHTVLVCAACLLALPISPKTNRDLRSLKHSVHGKCSSGQRSVTVDTDVRDSLKYTPSITSRKQHFPTGRRVLPERPSSPPRRATPTIGRITPRRRISHFPLEQGPQLQDNPISRRQL